MAIQNIIQIFKSAVSGRRPPTNGNHVGVPFVNFADKEFGVMNTSGIATDLLAVRHYSDEASYKINDLVNKDGVIYKAKAVVVPGVWDVAAWTPISMQLGETATTAYRGDHGKANRDDIKKRVKLAGDAMTGSLEISSDTAVGQLQIKRTTTEPTGNPSRKISFLDSSGVIKGDIDCRNEGMYIRTRHADGSVSIIDNVHDTLRFNHTPLMKTGHTVNGTWIQMYDGTLICHHRKPAGIWQFPFAYATLPTVTATVLYGGSGAVYICEIKTITTTRADISVRSPTKVVVGQPCYLMSIGRWKV